MSDVYEQRFLAHTTATAAELKRQQKWQEARVLLENAVAMLPGQPELYDALGHTLLNLHDYEAGCAVFRQSLNAKQDDQRTTRDNTAYRGLGMSLFLFADTGGQDEATTRSLYEEAATAFEKAISINPADVQTFYHLGSSRLRSGDSGAALSAYARAVELDSNHASATEGLACAHFYAGNLSEAAEYYQAAARLSPEKASIHHGLGCAFLNSGSVEDALPALREAVRLAPANPKYLHCLVNALERVGDFEAAKVAREPAMKPTSPKTTTAQADCP